MTEGRALILTVAISLLLSAILFSGLMALSASPMLVFLAFVLVLVLGVNGTSSVILHYGKERR